MYRWFAWNILFRLHERAKGHDTFRYLREMETTDSFTMPQLEELRARKLRDLIEDACAHVPYFRLCMRKGRLDPTRIREPKDLALLPLMRKADVRENREVLRSDIAGKLSSFTTGGSTGEPLIFDLSKR